VRKQEPINNAANKQIFNPAPTGIRLNRVSSATRLLQLSFNLLWVEETIFLQFVDVCLQMRHKKAGGRQGLNPAP
jgi:hypothetical protein